MDFDDLIQFGNMGLLRAVETYDPTFGTKFVTYARYWIKQSIIRNSKRIFNPYKIPINLYEANNNMLKVIDILTVKLERIPTLDEVANYMGISNGKIKHIIDVFISSVSIDEVTGIYINGVELTRGELIADENVDLEKDMIFNMMISEVNECMNKYLSEREIFVLRNMYGFDDDKSLLELSKIMRISKARVGQIKTRALEKLRNRDRVQEMICYFR